MNSHFIFGCGFLGLRLATVLLDQRQAVWTVTRSADKAQELRQVGLQAHVADPAEWLTMAQNRDLPRFHTITVCIGNDKLTTHDHSEVYTSATQAALRLAARSSDSEQHCRIQFVSTTGVYASEAELTSPNSSDPSASPCIDEACPVGPTRPGSIASLQCEELLQQHAAIPFTIFRLAGIYSLARIPNLAKLKSNELIPGSGQGLLNLIHVADAAAILAYAAMNPPPWPVVNIADGQPVIRQAFYRYLATQFDLPSPRFSESAGRSGSKRIDVTRLQAWYPGPWLFPSYQAGLSESPNA